MMKRLKRLLSDIFSFAFREDVGGFFSLVIVQIVLTALATSSFFVEYAIKGNIVASLDYQEDNVARVYGLSADQKEDFLKNSLFDKKSGLNIRKDFVYESSEFGAIAGKAGASPALAISFCDSIDTANQLWNIGFNYGNFDGAYVSEQLVKNWLQNDGEPQSLIGQNIQFFKYGSDEGVFLEIPLTGIYSIKETPHFLFTVDDGIPRYDRIFLPMRYHSKFSEIIAEKRWSSNVVLKFQNPINTNLAKVLKSSFSSYDLRCKSYNINDIFNKLDITIFRYFRFSNISLLIFGLFAEWQILLSFLSKKKSDLFLRYVYGMSSKTAFSMQFISILVSFLLSVLIVLGIYSGLSLAFNNYLHGRIIVPFFIGGWRIEYLFMIGFAFMGASLSIINSRESAILRS